MPSCSLIQRDYYPYSIAYPYPLLLLYYFQYSIAHTASEMPPPSVVVSYFVHVLVGRVSGWEVAKAAFEHSLVRSRSHREDALSASHQMPSLDTNTTLAKLPLNSTHAGNYTVMASSIHRSGIHGDFLALVVLAAVLGLCLVTILGACCFINATRRRRSGPDRVIIKPHGQYESSARRFVPNVAGGMAAGHAVMQQRMDGGVEEDGSTYVNSSEAPALSVTTQDTTSTKDALGWFGRVKKCLQLSLPISVRPTLTSEVSIHSKADAAHASHHESRTANGEQMHGAGNQAPLFYNIQRMSFDGSSETRSKPAASTGMKPERSEDITVQSLVGDKHGLRD